jgi:hypothetical protein
MVALGVRKGKKQVKPLMSARLPGSFNDWKSGGRRSIQREMQSGKPDDVFDVTGGDGSSSTSWTTWASTPPFWKKTRHAPVFGLYWSEAHLAMLVIN